MSALSVPPTAIFATNHLVAAGVMLGAQRSGLSVPNDLSIASFYDGPVAELLNPALTAIRFPLQQLGYEAACTLMNIIEKRDAPISKVLGHEEIVVRGSTALAPKRQRRTAASSADKLERAIADRPLSGSSKDHAYDRHGEGFRMTTAVSGYSLPAQVVPRRPPVPPDCRDEAAAA